MNTAAAHQYLIIQVEKLEAAISIDGVLRVIQSLEITPVPDSPALIEGVFSLQGRMIPVVSLRKLMKRPSKPIALSDALVICEFSQHLMAFLCDDILGVFDLVATTAIDSALFVGHIPPNEVVTWRDRLVPVLNIDVLIHDFDSSQLTQLASAPNRTIDQKINEV